MTGYTETKYKRSSTLCSKHFFCVSLPSLQSYVSLVFDRLQWNLESMIIIKCIFSKYFSCGSVLDLWSYLPSAVGYSITFSDSCSFACRRLPWQQQQQHEGYKGLGSNYSIRLPKKKKKMDKLKLPKIETSNYSKSCSCSYSWQINKIPSKTLHTWQHSQLQFWKSPYYSAMFPVEGRSLVKTHILIQWRRQTNLVCLSSWDFED